MRRYWYLNRKCKRNNYDFKYSEPMYDNFDFQKCIWEALQYNTPGVEVRLEYPRHEYIENGKFLTNTNESKI